MQRLLTYENKDKLLDVLIEAAIVGQQYHSCDYTAILTDSELNEDELHALLSQFNRHGLIEYTGVIPNGHKRFDIKIHQEATDFKLRGGFKKEEEIMVVQLKKLTDEIENIKISNPLVNLANISAIATNLLEVTKIYFIGGSS